MEFCEFEKFLEKFKNRIYLLKFLKFFKKNHFYKIEKKQVRNFLRNKKVIFRVQMK